MTLFGFQGMLDVAGGWSPRRWLDNLGRSIAMSESRAHGVKHLRDLTSFFHSISIFWRHSPSVKKQSGCIAAAGAGFFLRETVGIEVCVKSNRAIVVVPAKP